MRSELWWQTKANEMTAMERTTFAGRMMVNWRFKGRESACSPLSQPLAGTHP